MNDARKERLERAQARLIKLAQAWAGKWAFDADEARALRREAILINHSHYLESVPAYGKLAREAGIGEVNDLDPIKKELMSTDDLFKSYQQEWLDRRDFGRMNEWLSTVFHARIRIDVTGVRTIDEWIARLSAGGVIPVYSSGTTGAFSFVPRDQRGWNLFTGAPVCYLTPTLLLEKNIGKWWQRLLFRPAARALGWESFARLVRRMGLPDYDGIFLNFRRGNMGIQLVGQEFARLFPDAAFLYDIDLSASALRLIARGATSDDDRKILADFQAGTIGKKDENYARVIARIKRAAEGGKKVFVFGAPYQVKELAEIVGRTEGRMPLLPDSFILFGGGWKTFEGERIEREALVKLIADTFGIAAEHVVEGYSMTEINCVMVRCEHGRFHVPPVLEPVILDEELRPLEGNDVSGAFGFLDPFAVSYPGFIISGDNVRMIDGECGCGLSGPAFTSIARAPGREVKGCGGIMASVRA
ncbi:MAG TPA: hypothetical protein VM658_19410 [bacterium]|nr:hypothetical protein [bacterium]